MSRIATSYLNSPDKKKESVQAEAFKVSLPVFFGYFPFGLAFGLLFCQMGYHWVYAFLSGMIVYAGAAQFLSVGLIAAGASLNELFISVFLLNIRHIFYGFPLISRYQMSWKKRIYLMFGLTDETFSVLTIKEMEDKKDDAAFCFWVTFFNHCYWMIGCLAGGLLAGQLTGKIKGLDFVLVALFVVLTIEQAKNVRTRFPFVIAIAAAIPAILLDKSQFLMIALGFALLGTVVVSVMEHRKDGGKNV